MAKTGMIRVLVEPDLKQEAEEVFSTLGLSPTDAIVLFYKHVTSHHDLPFAVNFPNAETREALRQAEDRENLIEYEVTRPQSPVWLDAKVRSETRSGTRLRSPGRSALPDPSSGSREGPGSPSRSPRER